jgi:hypothetical protein
VARSSELTSVNAAPHLTALASRISTAADLTLGNTVVEVQDAGKPADVTGYR